VNSGIELIEGIEIKLELGSHVFGSDVLVHIVLINIADLSPLNCISIEHTAVINQVINLNLSISINIYYVESKFLLSLYVVSPHFEVFFQGFESD